MNPELFYNQQLENDNITWRLDSGKGYILKGIIQSEEMGFSIGHSYNQGMSDPVGSVLKSVFDKQKSFQPLRNTSFEKMGSQVGNAVPVVGDAIKSVNTAIQTGLTATENALGSVLGSSGDDLRRAMNGSFLAATDLIKTFTGSQVGYNFPQLSTIILHDPDNPVKTQLTQMTQSMLGEVKDFGGIYGLQYAPNDYRPDLNILNMKGKNIEGTWTLSIGKLYKFTNLVIENVQVDLSKFRVKTKTGGNHALYAIVTVTVAPASYVTRDDLREAMLS